MRATPAVTTSVIELFEPRDRLLQVFVPAPAQANEVKSLRRIRRVSGGFGGQKPRDCVGGLQRRQDSLQPGQLAERAKRLDVRHRFITRAARVPKLGVLGSDPGIVEARGDGM